MGLINIAWRSLAARRSSAILTVLTISLSVALLLGVDHLRHQTKQSFASTISGTDLIVGARTGQTQLLLYSVFHIGEATDNISWESYQKVANDPKVDWTIPIALGDSHKGYRVVGTNNDFFEHYQYGRRNNLDFAQGHGFEDVLDVVLGAEVARKLGYEIGDNIVVSHGVSEISFADHDEHPFEVVGILAPTGTPVDRSLMVGLDAIELIHLPYQDETHSLDLTPDSVTAYLVGLKSRVAVFGLQRQINSDASEPMLAILPGIALAEMWQMVAMIETALLAITACVVVTGLLSMLAALLASLKERRREMAILRSVGARPMHVFALLIFEATLLTALGCALGVASFYALVLIAKPILLNLVGFNLGLSMLSLTQLYMLAAVLVCGTVAGVIPAWQAYRNSLSDGMSIRV
ncbi:ABC transporter permease [Paraferrimonas sedimenticola]|uniref:Peptide ABC transporter permease n=1 Tax=Paraferrimonas sedimenticola TaxID=375674 RepID=A0AA37RW18_9GAMM|nr:ABC transporter permease [Paraferrimonas sedimenticola]GLP96276.1 peptide ABC transporter permease [Paraferrimonas sedimenticola]